MGEDFDQKDNSWGRQVGRDERSRRGNKKRKIIMGDGEKKKEKTKDKTGQQSHQDEYSRDHEYIKRVMSHYNEALSPYWPSSDSLSEGVEIFTILTL